MRGTPGPIARGLRIRHHALGAGAAQAPARALTRARAAARYGRPLGLARDFMILSYRYRAARFDVWTVPPAAEGAYEPDHVGRNNGCVASSRAGGCIPVRPLHSPGRNLRQPRSALPSDPELPAPRQAHAGSVARGCSRQAEARGRRRASPALVRSEHFRSARHVRFRAYSRSRLVVTRACGLKRPLLKSARLRARTRTLVESISIYAQLPARSGSGESRT